ncbi:MAG: hypothetical protein MPF33_02890 [Candidatus Aramenus sp.]|nr:hypothetical protein [Candidatus Aramenus sp.]
MLSTHVLITANAGDLGEKSIIVGNLQRMKTVISPLDKPRWVSEFGLLHVCRELQWRESVVFRGIGIPSLTLVTHDLYNLGVR